jgi:hypothetical protein
MKKFGTPIGAGPGSESEKLGFEADGTPFPVGSATFFLALALRWPPELPLGVFVACGWLEGFCFLVGRLGTGLGAVLEDDEVEVELEVELEDDDELELELEDDELVVVLEELLLSGTQFSVSDEITPATGGRLRLVTGVPGATLGTVKV